jgi:uncharacterized protein YggT (Ycf19 family)
MSAALIGPFFRIMILVLSIIRWTVFIWVILSWILFFASQTSFRWRNRGLYNVLTQLNDIFTRMTWPFLKPFRKLLRRYDTAGIDWSPLLLLLVILLIEWLLEGLYVRLILVP